MAVRLTVNEKAKAICQIGKARHELELFLRDKMEIARQVPVTKGVTACEEHIKPVNDELAFMYPTIVPEFYFVIGPFSGYIVDISYRLSGIGDVSSNTLTELGEALSFEGKVELSGDHLRLFTLLTSADSGLNQNQV